MTQTDLFPGQSGLPVDNPTESYWHREPSEKLLGHRTTEQLPRTADVVIVGSGITGAFAAHFLKEKRPDLEIVMLEAREACWGATGRNGGHCQPAMYAAAPHIASFELRNYAYLKTLVESYSIACDWHSTSGVHAYYSKPLFAEVRRAVERLADTYPDLAANVELVTKSGGGGGKGSGGGSDGGVKWLLEQERRETTLEGLRVGRAEGAVVQWHAASLWPYKLVAFVLERLLAAGRFNLQTKTPVTGLSSSPSPSPSLRQTTAAAAPAANLLWTAHTPRGSVTAPRVLLATNAYTSHLLPPFADLIVPVRGQVSSLKPPPPPPFPSTAPTTTAAAAAAPAASDKPSPPLDIGHTFYIAGEPDDPYSRDDYLIQRPPAAAELVFGGGRQHARGRGVGVWDDGDIDEPVAWYLRGELGNLVDLSHAPPAGNEAGEGRKRGDLEPTRQWTGIMGFSRDGHPWVGGVPAALGGGPGLAVCAGYTGHGMPNAVLSAKAAAQHLLLLSRVGGVGEGADADGEEEEEEIIDLPPEYLVTEERAVAARLWDEVDVVDAKGSLFMEWGDMRV
ncbi:hypothetical protein SLS62_003288 [Diatrype stigma]|uniref:FAD dependent oxidoreductase domain-containing protein n=1 Tax=Diatrype stigma TaxID=117547 RepID=A0AAN9YUT3_9PEZI